MKILIVGAGPSGLAAALELGRLGLSATIVDKRSEPSEFSRAVGILPETLSKLDHAGVAEKIRNEAIEIRNIDLHQNTKPILHLNFDRAGYKGHPMRALPQNRTEKFLRSGLDTYNMKVIFEREVLSVIALDHTTKVHFSDETEEEYDWVIAADGTRSVIRESLCIKYNGVDLDEEWSIADVYVEDYPAQTFSAWVQIPPQDFVFVIPMEANRVRVAASTPDALATLPTPLKITNIRRQGTFRISIRQAETYKKGRVLLVGDAAHSHSPVGGRGMNLGIDDGIHAARAIAEDTTDNYSDARHKLGKSILDFSEFGRRSVTTNNMLTKIITRLVMFAAHHVPIFQRLLLKRLTSL